MICNNITFDGLHCLADMGLIYVPASTKPIVAPQRVYSYTIGGAPGTAAYGDQQTLMEYQMTGVFYPADDLANEIEARRLWRRIAQWLGVGRRHLILDSEPDKYIIAEVLSMDNDEYGWIDGGLQVTWLCQPYHWAVKPEEIELQIDGKDTLLAGVGVTSWYVETALPAPVDATITNDGTNTITMAGVRVGDKRVQFRDMELLPGERIELSMMVPIGAVIVAEDGAERSALEYMTTFERLISTGTEAPRFDVEFATVDDGNSAHCLLKVHGCWR